MSNEVTVKTYDLNYGFDLNHPYYRFTRAVDVPENTLTTVTTVPAVPGIFLIKKKHKSS